MAVYTGDVFVLHTWTGPGYIRPHNQFLSYLSDIGQFLCIESTHLFYQLLIQGFFDDQFPALKRFLPGHLSNTGADDDDDDE